MSKTNKSNSKEKLVEKIAANKDKKVKTPTYSNQAYCNLIGAIKSIKFVANLKFKKEGVKTAKEWEQLFKKHQLIPN